MKFKIKHLKPLELAELLNVLKVTGHDYYFSYDDLTIIRIPKTASTELKEYIEEKQYEDLIS